MTKSAQIVGTVTNGGRRTNIEDAIKEFNEKAEELRSSGKYDWVYNPLDYQQKGKPWVSYMWESLDSILVDKPDIYLLPHWEESIGARLEVEFAKRLGLEIYGY